MSVTSIVDAPRTRSVSKTLTFDGTAGKGAVGAVPLFTVTGEVLIKRVVAFCTTLLGEAAPGGATITLGITNVVAFFIALTNALDIDSDEFWIDATPDANGIALPAGLQNLIITQNIIADVLVAAINSGVIRFDVEWEPLSSNGNVVAA